MNEEQKLEEVKTEEQALPEVQELDTSDVEEEFVPANNSGNPLVNGFRNKTVILPLAVLQKQFRELEKLVGGGFQEMSSQVGNQFQSMFQAFGRLRVQLNELADYQQALQNLLKVSEADLRKEVGAIQDKRREEAELKNDKAANLVVVDRASKEGDTVKIKYVGKIDGKEFEGGSSNGFQLVIGQGKFLADFEKQLVGRSANETFDVTLTFPENYQSKEVAGKQAVFATTLLAVKEVFKTSPQA